MLRWLFFIILIFLSVHLSSLAQHKPSSDFSNNDEKSEIKFQNQIIPAQQPSDVSSLVPGSLMLGLLADVSFPFGEDFKKYAGTGFSGHVIAGYSILNVLMVSLKVGYIKFGEKDVDFGLTKISQEEFSATQTNSQVPLLVGLYYTPGFDPTCLGTPGSCFYGGLLNPFIGLQFGPFFKTYTYKYEYNYILGKPSGIAETMETSESSTIFGIVPTAGTYYNISEKVRLIGFLEYNYLFEEADVDAANISFLSISLGASYKIL